MAWLVRMEKAVNIIKNKFLYKLNMRFLYKPVCFLFDSLCPITNLSIKHGRFFLGLTSTKLGLMCLAQGPQRSDAGEAWTRGPLVSSQALYHWATALPYKPVA